MIFVPTEKRPGDLVFNHLGKLVPAIAAGTPSAKTAKPVEAEGCQSGPKGIAQDRVQS